MPDTLTCIVAASGPFTVRPGGVPVGPGDVVVGVDPVANANALRREDLVPYDGPIPDDALRLPAPVVEPDVVEDAPPLGALGVAKLRAYAADRGIDLGSARTKSQIVAVIETATAITTDPGVTP